MKEKRYFYEGELALNSKILLEGDEFHHLSVVMRTRVGDRVCLFNGNGNFYFGSVLRIEKKYAEILIDQEQKSEVEPTVDVTIFQALAKGDKLSLIMQKITELGGTNLCLFSSEFCDVKPNTTKGERLEIISVSAAKQCGRATLTNFQGIKNIDEICSEIQNFDRFFVAYENEENLQLAKVLEENNLKKIAIMIGAEGGFSTKEIEKLKAHGATIVSLGKRILRTETAAIASTALATQILENK